MQFLRTLVCWILINIREYQTLGLKNKWIEMEDCIFCKIANNEAPAYVVWESSDHIAFLSRAPNTEGATVVIPKQHYSSYVFDAPEKVINDWVGASKIVAKILENSLDEVGRVAVVFEGFGINHLHAKLFPMHGTNNKEWEPIKSNVNIFFENSF